MKTQARENIAIKLKRIDPGIKILIFIFFLTVPLINPMLRSDGVGYYAYIHSLVIDGDLQFRDEWKHGDETTLNPPKLFEGDPLFVSKYRYINAPEYFLTTSTGLTPNRYSVGPALLWSPFFLAAHGVTRLLNSAGFNIVADGYSPIYFYAVAFGSALYAFMGILMIYKISLQYFSRRIVLFSIVVVWFASSLVAYMFGHPILSHSVSFFAISLLLFYWFSRRNSSLTTRNWFILGILSGLVVSIRINDILFCSIPILAQVNNWYFGKRKINRKLIGQIFQNSCFFLIGGTISLLPTFIVGKILYGVFTITYQPYALTPEKFPNVYKWEFTSPAFFKVLFSSMHGIFSWTPVLFLSCIGILLFIKKDKFLGILLLILFLMQVYWLGSLVNGWEQGSSFGARIFVNFTPMYILGLCALTTTAKKWISPPVLVVIGMLFIIWNLEFLIQFGLGLVPRWDYINWRQMVYNQIITVPNYLITKMLTFVSLPVVAATFIIVTLIVFALRNRIVRIIMVL